MSFLVQLSVSLFLSVAPCSNLVKGFVGTHISS
jgi:hypothetical protein